MFKRISHIFFVVGLLTANVCSLSAQERMDSLSLRVFFRQDKVDIDFSYRDNRYVLDKFVADVQEMMQDTTCIMQDIVIKAGASPEGAIAHNIWLSEERGKALKNYLMPQLELRDEQIQIVPLGEDWGLLRKIVEKTEFPGQADVVKILDKYSDYISKPQKYVMNGPKKELMDLKCGKTWRWMLENIYPDLRGAGNTIVCHFVRTAEPEPARTSGRIIDTVYIIHQYMVAPDSTMMAAYGAGNGTGNYRIPDGYEPKVKKARKHREGPGYRFAIKTNLLYDVVAAPEIELEFPIGKRVSIMGEYVHPWWTFKDNRYAFQLQSGGLETRIWLGDRNKRSILSGAYLGIYGSGVQFDFEWDSKGNQVPWTWTAGLTAGWSFPLGKNDNWRLDLGLGVGYMPYKYDYYERHEEFGLLVYKNSGTGTWIGPTKAKCSIAWIIPMNKKAKKAKKEAGNE